jgi:TolA-binding protein
MNLKASARMAFGSASKMDFDKKIKEESMFDFAKLSYELGFSPFNEAIKAFQAYISNYPESPRLDEAYNYLTDVYLSTKNYREAVNALENIKSPTPRNEEAFQRASFFRAIELFNDLDYEQAIIHFDKSLNNAKYNESFRAQSLYWRGEAYYRLQRYDDAIASYNKFLLTSGAFGTPEYLTAYYNLGYSYYKKKEYDKAITWFRKYSEKPELTSTPLLDDSYTRTADCYFISKKYDRALDFYQKTAELKTSCCDYALFQLGFCHGLLKDQDQKITVLNKLLSDFPNSSYVDDALYELGNAYVILDNKESALKSYQSVLNDYPTSSWIKKSYLKMALIYYNNNKNEEAIGKYKEMISKYPGSPEVKEALQGLKNVYVDINDVNKYFEYLKEIGQSTESSRDEQDSLTYSAGEKLYLSGDCDKSKEDFRKYLLDFPGGIFAVNANFYKAECNYKAQEFSEALEGYKFVISKPKNLFTEKSLVRASDIYYSQKNYADALACYIELQKSGEYQSNLFNAVIGEMRCHFQLGNAKDALNAAGKTLALANLPENISREAHFITAKSSLQTGDTLTAIKEFRMVSSGIKSAEGAESKYILAEIAFMQKKYDVVENEVFDFVKKNTPHQYWLAKSFLVLADMYLARGNNFQAKQTLKSLIDNYDNKTDGIIESAINIMNEIIRNEELLKMKQDSINKALNAPKDTSCIHVKFDEPMNPNDVKLYDENNLPDNNSGDAMKPDESGTSTEGNEQN